MNPATLTRSYFPALDGLRGIAILLVVFTHNYNFLSFSGFAWVGVDLFFVLSGFLITDILLRTKEEKNFLQNFYIRRVLRIFPLYYIMLLLFFLLVPFISQYHDQYKYYQVHQEMAWFHLINWLYIFEQQPGSTMLLGHFWSLSVEEQFYLVWPFVILLFKNQKHLVRFIYIAIVACAGLRLITWMQWGGGYTGFTFHYMTRIDGLCIGSLLAVWRLNHANLLLKKFSRFALVILVIYLIICLAAYTIFPGLPHFMLMGYSLIGTLFGFAVILAISGKTVYTNLLLENSLLKYLGKISYGLYIFHWPVFALLRLLVWDRMLSTGINDTVAHFILSTSALMIAIGVSSLSYIFFERRILALKDVITADGFFARVRQKLVLLLNPASAK